MSQLKVELLLDRMNDNIERIHDIEDFFEDDNLLIVDDLINQIDLDFEKIKKEMGLIASCEDLKNYLLENMGEWDLSVYENVEEFIFDWSKDLSNSGLSMDYNQFQDLIHDEEIINYFENNK